MIASYKHTSQGLGPRDHLIGIPAISDGISQVHNTIVRRRCGQTRVECLEVTVNIAKDQDVHGKGRIIAWNGMQRCSARCASEKNRIASIQEKGHCQCDL